MLHKDCQTENADDDGDEAGAEALVEVACAAPLGETGGEKVVVPVLALVPEDLVDEA